MKETLLRRGYVWSKQTQATRNPALSRVSDHYSLHSGAIYPQSKPAVVIGEPYLHGGQDAELHAVADWPIAAIATFLRPCWR
jgi:hypothetical protein